MESVCSDCTLLLSISPLPLPSPKDKEVSGTWDIYREMGKSLSYCRNWLNSHSHSVCPEVSSQHRDGMNRAESIWLDHNAVLSQNFSPALRPFTFLQRNRSHSWWKHGKMLSITNQNEMQIKSTTMYHLPPTRMAVIKKAKTNTCWQESGGERAITYWCWKHNSTSIMENTRRFCKRRTAIPPLSA